MKIIYILILFFFVIIFSCENHTSGVQNFDKKDSSHKLCDSNIIKNSNIFIKNPDTSLALFLWLDSSNRFDESIEEYTRFALENSKISELIQYLFGDCIEFSNRRTILNQRLQSFDLAMKKEVLNEGIQYGNLSDSKELWYVKQTNIKFYDSLIKIYPLM